MKKQIVVLLSAVLVAMTLVAIWCFSAQAASESSLLSGKFAQIMAELPGIGTWLEFGAWDHVVRKLAHGTIYFVLGAGLAGMLVTQKTRISVYLVPTLGVILAAIDEYHQSFVPGRYPSAKDVTIDVIGVILGLALVLALRRFYLLKSRHSQNKSPS